MQELKELRLKLTENLKKVQGADRKLDSPAIYGGKEKEIIQEVRQVAEDSLSLFKQMKSHIIEDSDAFEDIGFSQALLHYAINSSKDYVDGKTNVNPKRITYRTIQAIEARF